MDQPAQLRSQKRHYPHAKSPMELRWSDWKEIFKRVKHEVTADRIDLIAAAVAYYAIFSIFPLLIATVSIYGIFANPGDVKEQLQQISQFIPRDALGVIDTQLSDIVGQSSGTLGFGALSSVVLALWTGSKGTRVLMEAMNIAYDEKEKRGFIRFNSQALLLTLGAVLTVIFAISAIAVVPAIMDLIGLGGLSNTLILVLRWPFLILLFAAGLAILNRYGPSRDEPKWRWVSVGGALTTFLILLASAGFAFYAENYGDYNKTYGSLAGVIILLLWLYIISYAVLLGIELNAEIEFQTTADSTKGPSRPMGQRGAVKADNTPATMPNPGQAKPREQPT